jgi:hypothetical protein
VGNEWNDRLQRQKEFFKEGKGNFLVFAQYERQTWLHARERVAPRQSA